MAAGDDAEKTEEPTAKRKSDARKKGNIPKSRDMTAALMLLAAIYLLRNIGPRMAHYVLGFTRQIIKQEMPFQPIPERKEVIPVLIEWIMWMGAILAPFMVVMCIAAYVTGYIQVGFLITTEPLKLKFNKFNPVAGIKRLFNTRNLVMLIMNIAKLAVILSVAWATVYYEFQNVITMVEMEAAGAFIYTTDRVLSLATRLAWILLVLGIADFYYQKWKNHKEMKMTKQQVKEEFKQMEGDPQIKSKRRQKMMELAMQRMMGEVPQAEVVVRNPTHFAVAISYKPGMPAPMVVAKGKNKVAERIIEAAREAGVPLVENPPLARQLYKSVELGAYIPEELFATVAEVLTSVMNAEKKRRMMESLAKERAA